MRTELTYLIQQMFAVDHCNHLGHWIFVQVPADNIGVSSLVSRPLM